MKIRSKIILVVLPIIITALVVAGFSAFFKATSGITNLARDFLDFKSSELEKEAQSRWNLLVTNNLTDNGEMVEATKQGITVYAFTVLTSKTEVILAIDKDINIILSTKDIKLQENETKLLRDVFTQKQSNLLSFAIGGTQRVAKGFYFEPFDWYFLVTEEKNTFYAKVDEIKNQTVIVLIASSLASIFLLIIFAGYLTYPLTKVVSTMKDIISTNDLSERVMVEFQDETGQLAHTFNLMVSELEKAYNQIKRFAFSAVLSQKKEQKIRNIFQRYVPKDVIDRFFQKPESMLVGEDRVLAILFSDIRSFTTISESMMPDDLVNSLNRYFSFMVDIIIHHKGIVDKYIGDAIMAFFGAPVKHDDDALQSVLSGLEMLEALNEFNKKQLELGKPEFHIGIGINYGVVTVGNIGTEKKMDYTVIGDNVNLASRLEGLTKQYKQPFIISESLYYKVHQQLPCRLIDTVAVKGKTKGVKIFAVKKSLLPEEKAAWSMHHKAMDEYYNKNFSKAASLFNEVGRLLKHDYASAIMLKRARYYAQYPPPPNWNGIEHMTKK